MAFGLLREQKLETNFPCGKSTSWEGAGMSAAKHRFAGQLRSGPRTALARATQFVLVRLSGRDEEHGFSDAWSFEQIQTE